MKFPRNIIIELLIWYGRNWENTDSARICLYEQRLVRENLLDHGCRSSFFVIRISENCYKGRIEESAEFEACGDRGGCVKLASSGTELVVSNRQSR